MTSHSLADLAREVAKKAETETAWNYDTIECVALTAVRDAFNDFARLIDEAQVTA